MHIKIQPERGVLKEERIMDTHTQTHTPPGEEGHRNGSDVSTSQGI